MTTIQKVYVGLAVTAVPRGPVTEYASSNMPWTELNY